MSFNTILGWSRWDPATRVPLVYPGEASVLTNGIVGSGKSRSVALPNLIRGESSMVVADFQDGQLTAASAMWRAIMLCQDVRIFDSFRLVPAISVPKVSGRPAYASADPLDFIRNDSAPVSAAMKIAEAINPAGALKEPHWAEGAQLRMASTMLFVASDPVFDLFDKPRDMSSVWLLLSDPEYEQLSLRAMSDRSENQFIADQAMAFRKAGKNNTEMAGIRNQIRVGAGRIFNEPGIMSSLTGTNIDFGQLVKIPTTIYMVLPGRMAETHAKFMTILLTMMFGCIERAGVQFRGGQR